MTESIEKPNKNPLPRPKRGRCHPIRDASGKFAPLSPKKETFWGKNSAAAFYAWLSDIQPMILTRGGIYELFIPTDDQRAFINEVLSIDDSGNFKHSISLNIMPRRHGKSTIFALIVLWLFTTRENFTIQLSGNGEDHARRVQFNLLIKIIQHTKKLTRMIPDKCIQSFSIQYPEKDNVIQRITGQNTATAFGDRLNVLWVSDFHACPDLGPWNAFQAALLDSEGSLCFIDSNADSHDGHVHVLEKEAAHDPTIYANYVCYNDFNDFSVSAPPWIDRQKARRMERTALPTDFKRDILGQRSSAVNSLFPQDVIELCKDQYRCPVEDIHSITKGRKFVVGGGLDRSKPWSLNQDGTIWTTTLKVASPEHGEPEYFILNQEKDI